MLSACAIQTYGALPSARNARAPLIFHAALFGSLAMSLESLPSSALKLKAEFPGHGLN